MTRVSCCRDDRQVKLERKRERDREREVGICEWEEDKEQKTRLSWEYKDSNNNHNSLIVADMFWKWGSLIFFQASRRLTVKAQQCTRVFVAVCSQSAAWLWPLLAHFFDPKTLVAFSQKSLDSRQLLALLMADPLMTSSDREFKTDRSGAAFLQDRCRYQEVTLFGTIFPFCCAISRWQGDGTELSTKLRLWPIIAAERKRIEIVLLCIFNI